MKSRKEINRKKLAASAYPFIFTPGSEVFHLKSCPCLLRVKGFNGTTVYATAAKGRRPCKRCRPLPEHKHELPVKRRVSFPQTTEKTEVKLVGGGRALMGLSRIVGLCHYYLHPGALTLDLMREHDCLKKQCPYFEENTHAAHWHQKRAAKAAKEQARQRRQGERERLENLEHIRQQWQACADELGLDLLLVRIQRDEEKWRFHTIYYVSPRAYADFEEYWDLIDRIKRDHPRWSLYLRHIRDVDGHYVTTREYLTRRKK